MQEMMRMLRTLTETVAGLTEEVRELRQADAISTQQIVELK